MTSLRLSALFFRGGVEHSSDQWEWEAETQEELFRQRAHEWLDEVLDSVEYKGGEHDEI